MEKITVPLMTEEVGEKINESLKGIQSAILLQTGNSQSIVNWDDVQRVVRGKQADRVFSYGDQLIEKYTVSDTVSYDVPMNVVSFDDGELQDGEVIKTMTLQWHYSTPDAVQFLQRQAFYVSEEIIPAGTYNVVMGYNWGNVVKDRVYQFTLTQPVPVGGLLRGFDSAANTAIEEWKVKSYATQMATTPIETVAVTEGSGGTNLGTFLATENGNLNSLQLVALGNNRYRDSAVRQWLNSSAPAGQWWQPQSKWDSAPDSLPTLKGFLANFPPEFVSKMRPCKMSVMTNTVTDGGVEDVMYDKVFLPSLGNIWSSTQVAGEWPEWKYWQRVLGATVKPEIYRPYAAYKTYSIANKTTSFAACLRSANRSSAGYVWYLSSSGTVNDISAYTAFRYAPACRIG